MNKNNSHINEELPVKYLLGEATPEERVEVEQWMAADDAHKKEFEHLRYLWTEIKKLEPESNIDVEGAWEKFQDRIEKKDRAEKKRTPLILHNNWLRVAATLIIFLGGAYFAYFSFYGNRFITLESNGMVRTQVLPDGSSITLNKHTKIRYPKQFNGKTREIDLEGEAFFNVSPNKEKPFIIHTNEADIKVVGTSFNVKSDETFTEVIVETGTVQVKKELHSVLLQPKEKATVSQKDLSPLKEKNQDELYNYYRTKEFICNNTPLERLVEVLNTAYDVQIVIVDSRLKKEQITTTFHDESLENILHIVSTTLNIHTQQHGDKIIIQ